jgi:hypothetical protein
MEDSLGWKYIVEDPQYILKTRGNQGKAHFRILNLIGGNLGQNLFVEIQMDQGQEIKSKIAVINGNINERAVGLVAMEGYEIIRGELPEYEVQIKIKPKIEHVAEAKPDRPTKWEQA